MQIEEDTSMGCPCANPPGKGGVRPVPRNPFTMHPISYVSGLTRDDIRRKRVKRPMNPIDTESVDREVQRPVRHFVQTLPRPMGGFLSDAIRKR